MKKFLRKEGGFTLIELLVVILIIGILIAVAAPSFLGQTKKANDSSAKQYNAIGYKALKAYAIDGADADGTVIDANHSQGSFSGFSQTVLLGFEPGSQSTVSGVTATGAVFTAVVGGRTCTLTLVSTSGALPAQSCSG